MDSLSHSIFCSLTHVIFFLATNPLDVYECAPEFSEERFRAIRLGMSEQEVLHLVGEPIAQGVWCSAFDDRCSCRSQEFVTNPCRRSSALLDKHEDAPGGILNVRRGFSRRFCFGWGWCLCISRDARRFGRASFALSLLLNCCFIIADLSFF